MQDNSDLIIRDCCEAEVAEFGQPDTICITVDVLREIVQRHSPGTCLHQITEPQAAPAAVAVPDSSNLGFAVEQRGDVWVVVDDAGGVCPASPHECALWNALIEARAALAASPAQSVVLPEPDAAITEVMGLMRDWGRKEHLSGEAQLDAACSEATPVDEDRAKRCWAEEREAWQAIETKLRALLARVSAPVPQAVEQAPVLYVSQGQLANHRDPDGPDSTAHGRYLPARVTPAGKFTTPLFAAPHALTPAARDVLAERQRQITQEGYDPQHDDDHVNEEIAAMAALFIMPEGARDWDATSTSYGDTLAEALLPSDWEMLNFGDDRRRQLVKGTAMGLAEIERIDRTAIAAAKGE